MGWLGISLNEWLLAGFLIALVLLVPRLGDLGVWIADRTKGPSSGPPEGGASSSLPTATTPSPGSAAPARVTEARRAPSAETPADDERSDG